MVIGIIFGLILLLGFAFIIHEFKNSVEVDPKEPFLYGDYDEKKDPVIKFQETFCNNCKFSDGVLICLKSPLSEINEGRMNHCKKENMFNPK